MINKNEYNFERESNENYLCDVEECKLQLDNVKLGSAAHEMGLTSLKHRSPLVTFLKVLYEIERCLTCKRDANGNESNDCSENDCSSITAKKRLIFVVVK